MKREGKTGRDNPLFVQVLEKGVHVLRSFTAQRKTMTLVEIAEATGLSKSSVQRLVYSLEVMGYVAKHPKTRRFHLTPKVMEIGYNYLAADSLVDVANPFLAELTNATGETTNLMEPSDFEMVYVARFTSRRHIPIHMPIGSRIPMYCTASGKAYLAALPPASGDEMLRGMSLRAHTPHTITDPRALESEIAAARTLGYAMNSEELYPGDVAIATAIQGGQGAPIAALTIITPPSRWTVETIKQQLLPHLMECARSISNAVRTFG